MSNEKLTMQDFSAIAGALQRLHELKNQLSPEGTLILTKDRRSAAQEVKAETEGLVEFLATKLIENGQELLGCWVAVRTEYEPFCRAALPIFRRLCAGAAQDETSARAAAKKQYEDAAKAEVKSQLPEEVVPGPDNVIPLIQPTP